MHGGTMEVGNCSYLLYFSVLTRFLLRRGNPGTLLGYSNEPESGRYQADDANVYLISLSPGMSIYRVGI